MRFVLSLSAVWRMFDWPLPSSSRNFPGRSHKKCPRSFEAGIFDFYVLRIALEFMRQAEIEAWVVVALGLDIAVQREGDGQVGVGGVQDF